jgi:hypothetical protein
VADFGNAQTTDGTNQPQIIVRSEKDLEHVILQTKVDPSFEFGVQRGKSFMELVEGVLCLIYPIR